MTTSAATFDNSLAQWTTEQSLPWGRLKYKLVQANLAKHIGQAPLHILDAGGGNGFDSIPLAEQGHTVHIVDYSTGMLAEAAHQAAILNADERVTLHCADVRNIPDLFPDNQFDLVLCHNVLQYVDDVAALLSRLIVPLKTGGLISIVSINRYSIPYHAAFLHGNLTDALAQLDTRSMKGNVFDTTLISYGADEVSDMLNGIGCVVEQDYGIRCICDYWGDNERKSDPTVFEQIERLELALTERHPYKLLARYFQVIASKR